MTKEGSVIRTVMQILTKLLVDNPYQCEICKRTASEIVAIMPDKEWIRRYINLPGRSPPKEKTFIEIIKGQRVIAV